MATSAWQRKEGQNPSGGLNDAGRASYKAQTGGTLKAPVKGRPYPNLVDNAAASRKLK